MSSKIPFPPPGFDELSAEEQAEYVQALWDHISSPTEPIDVPDWHLEILEERLARYDANGMQGIPWDQFKKEFLQELLKS
jgi:putative addiction module component (TIGR02574 family)